jgi:hypothetical protein
MILAAPPASLVSMFDSWAGFYGDSSLAQTVVTFAHVGGLVVGGGAAIAADRATLRMASDVDRRRHLLDIGRLHRTVIISLAVVMTSGLLLLTADIETFWGSWIFWTKMILVVLLLLNGARMRSVERAAVSEPVVSAAHWGAMRGTALTSLALWMTITLAGVALINYA